MVKKDIFNEMKSFFAVSSLEDVAEKLGYARSTAATWRSKGLTESALNKYNIERSKVEKLQNSFNTTNDNTAEGYWIKKLDHKVGAGTSVDISQVDLVSDDDHFFVPMTFFKTIMKNEKLRIAQVDGYSMIPMLFPDSWVIFEKGNDFRGDGLYVINYNDNLMVKILQKKPNGNLYIKSVNKDYDSFEIESDSQENILIIGKVLRCII